MLSTISNYISTLNPLVPQIGLLALLLVSDLCTSTLIKQYHLSGWTENRKMFLAVLFYMAVPFVILMSMKYEGIGNTNMYWNVISTIFVYILAVYFFHEKITNMQYLGIFLAIVGVLLVIWNR